MQRRLCDSWNLASSSVLMSHVVSNDRAMRLSTIGMSWMVLSALLGCSTTSPQAESKPHDRPRLDVPHFRKDDARVSTAGFFGHTTRINRTVGDTTYTLMIFAVGDMLTLGAMVKGEFGGTARWTVGERALAIPLYQRNRGRTDVPTEGAERSGQHAGFGDFDWVNVDVPLREWLTRGTPVRLEFHAEGAGPVVLPEVVMPSLLS